MARSPQLFRDDSGGFISAPEGMAGVYGTTGIATATTGAATAEVDISGLFTAAKNVQNSIEVCIVNGGSNAALYAFAAAGASASFGDNTTMAIIPAGAVLYRRLDSPMVSLYHKQISGATTLQVQVLT